MMEKLDNSKINQDGHFSDTEMTEILNFIKEDQEENKLIDTDKVAEAWSQVRRKHLFGRQ